MAAWDSAPLVEDQPKKAGSSLTLLPLGHNDGDPNFSASLALRQDEPSQPAAAWQAAPIEGEAAKREMPKRAKTPMEQARSLVGAGPGTAAIGAAETGLSMVSGLGGQIAGGLAGLGILASDRAGGASFDEAASHAADTIRGIQEAVTYQPRTEAGQLYSHLASLPMKYAGEATGFAGEKIGGAVGAPVAGRAIGEVAPQIGATLLGGTSTLKALGKPEAVIPAKAPRTPKEEVTQMAQDRGYVFPPKDLPGAGVVGKTLQAVGGKQRTEQTAAIRNQPVTNDWVKEDLGIPKGVPIDKDSIAQVTERATAPYRAIEKIQAPFKATDMFRSAIGDLSKNLREFGKKYPNIVKNDEIQGLVDDLSKDEFSPAESVFILRRLREQGRANLAGARIKPDAIKTELGRAQLQAAGAMEDLVEQRLGEMGQPKLLDEFRQGRRLYAKAMQVARVTDTAGNVSAPALNRALEKGVPLDGNMLKIARVAGHYDRAMKLPPAGAGEEGLTIFDTWLAGGELAAGHPVAAAAVLLRPTIRGSLALGRMGQRPAAPMQLPMSQLATGAPYALAQSSGEAARQRALALQQGDPRLLPMSSFGQSGAP